MVACVESSPTSTIISKRIMVSSGEQPLPEDSPSKEDSIKAAVREATKKTQDRLAAFQKRQAMAAAAAARAEEERAKEPKPPPSKDALEAESTVTRLQALVGESRRLTAKTKDLQERSAAMQDASHTPKGRKLGDLFQNLHNSTGGGLNCAPQPGTPARNRSSSADSLSGMSTSSVTPGGSLAKGKKLGAIFHSLNGSKGDLSESTGKLAHEMSQITENSLAQQANLKQHRVANNTSNNNKKGERRTSQPAIARGKETNELDLAVVLAEEEKKKARKKKKKEPTADQQEDDDNSSGEYSIFSLVDSNQKESAVYATAGVQALRPDEIQDLMEEYYNEPAKEKDKLEEVAPTPTRRSSKLKPRTPNSSRRKKKSRAGGEDDDHDRSLPLLEGLEDRMNARDEAAMARAGGKSMSAIREGGDGDMDSSMPCLSPFETPKVEKPRLRVAGTDLLGEDSMNLSQMLGGAAADLLLHDPASSRAAAKTNNHDSDASDGSHKSGLRRPSMELSVGPEPEGSPNSRRGRSRRKSNKEEESPSGNAHRAPSMRRRKSGDKKNIDDAASARSSRSKSTAASRKSKTNPRSSRKDDEIASRAINKYHRTAGQGSSTTMEGVDLCEVNGARLTSSHSHLDVSEISDATENDSILPDSSDSMGNGSSHSNRSMRFMSKSERRGRTVAGDSSRSRRASRSVSRTRRGASRSVSRTPSARRNRPPRQASKEEEKPGRRNSIAGTKPDEEPVKERKLRRDVSSRRARLQASGRDMSLRDSSMRDGRRRRGISTRRPSSRRSGRQDDESQSEFDQSQHSTAEEILGCLDVTDIKIVGGDGEKKKSKTDESGRSSIYDRPKARRNSLAGLSNLESAESPTVEGEDGDENSVQSSVTKKSAMGRFARKVGRRLTMKKKKGKGKEKGANDNDDDDEEEGGEEEEEDSEMALLSAEFDEEEREILGNATGGGLDDLADEAPKSKKKPRGSVFGKIAKIGKLRKKKKKKDKKENKKGDKSSEVLDSNSESEEDEMLGSGYSLDKSHSGSHDEDDIMCQSDTFALRRLDRESSFVATGSERTDDPVTITPKGRLQRRGSTVTQRRLAAHNQKRSMSLQATLATQGMSMSNRGEDCSVQGSVAPNMKQRRAISLRGKVLRHGESDEPTGSKFSADVRRAHSLKGGRIEGEVDAKLEKNRDKVKRCKSADLDKMEMTSGDDGDAPGFDWLAYSARTDSGGRKGRVGRRRSIGTSDKKMTGGLSKVIYAGQPVTS